MEKYNLEFLEDVITYASFLGEDKEIIFPSIVEYISEKTIILARNQFILLRAKEFYEEHKAIPTIYEMKTYMVEEEDIKAYSDFLRNYKNFKKNDFTRKILLGFIEEFFRQRLINDVMTESFIKTTAGEEIDIAEVYSSIEVAMSIRMCEDLGLNLFADVDEYIEELVNIDGRISTGFKWLDEQLGGGFLASGSVLYNFAAPSNVGKSNFIKSIACNMSAQGKNVLVVSLEMPRYIYANRFVAEMADLAIGKLVDNESEVRVFLEGGKGAGYGDIIIKDFATGSLTPAALGAYIIRTEKQLDIEFDCIFVDYPELMKPTRTFNNRHDLTIANLYIEVRALSFYLETPIGVVAQLNREGYDKENPTMQNIGSGIGIVQCSDFIGFLYSTDEMKAVNQIGMSIGKSRFGPVNRVKRYNVNENTLTITESSYEEEASPIQMEEDDGIAGIDPNDFFDDIFGEK